MDISALVQGQQAYHYGGATLSMDFRREALEKLSAAIGKMEAEIIAALGQDLGKSDIEAYMTEIGTVREELKFVLKNIGKWMKKVPVKSTMQVFPAKCYRVPEPYGVVLIMSPWNYPFMLTMEPLIGAIAAGNCVVIKPSAYAPATSAIIEKLVTACFPQEYISVVQGSRMENAQLLEQKFDYIFFTGSVDVGRIIMEAASKHLTPVTLELGGKSPVIVDETADIDLAARRLVFGKYMNSGQTCVAPDYVFVHESKKDALIAALRTYISKHYPKDANGNVIDYPHIINEKHFERLSGLLRGESIAIGGGTNPETLSIEPTVLDGTALDASVMQEEIFGPILPLIPYTELHDAIAEIRRRPKPLALYLFSTNKKTWAHIEQTVSFGGGCINDCMLHVSSSRLPFGGVGESGMGQYHGKASFDTFTHYKGIVNKSAKVDFDMRYRPYTEKKRRMIWR